MRKELRKAVESHRKKALWLRAVTCLSAVVVFCTVYALTLPALTQEMQCALPEHVHTDACYSRVDTAAETAVCSAETLGIHRHTAECYDAEGALICGYADFVVHTHDEACYDETGALWCTLPEVCAHEHTDACFETVTADDATGETQAVLTCTLPEIALHTHTVECYDAEGNRVCGMTEVTAHQHTDACRAALPLTCAITDETHVHTGRCYGTWMLTCGMEEHTHTEDCYFGSADEPAPADDAAPYAAGALNVSLLYGDGQPQSAHPDGVGYYTHSNMSGYIRLEPQNLDTDLTDVTVSLTIPKQYIEKDSISIPPFSTNSEITKYEILPVGEDGDNYVISIHFTAYDKTETLVLPFVLSFTDDVVPDNYELPVTASVSGGVSTTPSIYKPLYKEWGIDKFVNSNRYKEFKEDGAEVVVTPKEEDGNPYLDDLTYVDFAFTVNGCTYAGADLRDWRDACEVTLTDTLPKYTDKDGVERIAAFDADVNPGWTLSEDGLTVSKTYTGEHSGDVLTRIFNDTLHLRFPGLQFKTAQDGDLIADLDNTVHLTAVPSNAAEGETHPEADDPLRFRMTNDPSAQGRFSKWATKGDIYDMNSYKTNPYPWRVELANEKNNPLRHIIIQDRTITENGETLLEGLDEALKFVRLESDGHSTLASGQTFADVVDKVVAYYTDGTTQDYPITEDILTANGHFTVVFDENKVCNGYEIIFRDDYAMMHGEKTYFTVYTVYRDPEHTRVPDGQEKITYTNEARSVNSYQSGTDTVFVFLKQKGSYDMLPCTETLSVNKLTIVNNGSETWDGIGGNTVGSTYAYVIQLRGSLLEDDVKEYGDIRVVDLLPDGVHYEKIHLIQQSTSLPPVLDGGRNYQPEVIENYHNSGRTAVIFHFNIDNLRTVLNSKNGPDIYFGVTIDLDAHPGSVRNYVYVVGDNLNEYTEKTGGTEDIYDLNNNGRTDDRIAWSFSDATIIAAQSIYAEKYIAPAGSDNWSTHGLSVKAGASFDYRLDVTNETSADYTGLTIYDTLPQLGDGNIFCTAERGSEFHVQLRDAIDAPGYTVYYTTSPDVYTHTMQDMVGADIWSTDISDYSAVTAFKLVANDGTLLAGQSSFSVRIPVKAPETFSEEALARLHGKTGSDAPSGTVTYLEAVNAFGYKTAESPAEKESNSVWTRVPFAGFSLKKADADTGEAISGAEFTLTDAAGNTVGSAVSDENGLFSFRDLTEGVYTLTETKAPDGYPDKQLSFTVTITQNAVTMEYTVSLGDAVTGSGTSADPFVIENRSGYELPATGGRGLLPLYALGGALVLAASSALLLRRSRRRNG